MGHHCFFFLAFSSEITARIGKSSDRSDKFIWLQGFQVEYSVLVTTFSQY
jgi:hypothetical protein